MLEAAKATTETVDALRTGAAAMKAMQKATLVLILSPFQDFMHLVVEGFKMIIYHVSAETLMMQTRPWMKLMNRLKI